MLSVEKQFNKNFTSGEKIPQYRLPLTGSYKLENIDWACQGLKVNRDKVKVYYLVKLVNYVKSLGLA